MCINECAAAAITYPQQAIVLLPNAISLLILVGTVELIITTKRGQRLYNFSLAIMVVFFASIFLLDYAQQFGTCEPADVGFYLFPSYRLSFLLSAVLGIALLFYALYDYQYEKKHMRNRTEFYFLSSALILWCAGNLYLWAFEMVPAVC